MSFDSGRESHLSPSIMRTRSSQTPIRFTKGEKAQCLSANFAFREINPVSSYGFAWVDAINSVARAVSCDAALGANKWLAVQYCV